MSWFYGVELYIITNFKGEVVVAQLTTVNVHHTKPVSELVAALIVKIYADKCVDLVTNVRKNMMAKTFFLWDRAMLLCRFIIEIINDQLKNISPIAHSRHRSSHYFMLN
jgi:hypothetical protein